MIRIFGKERKTLKTDINTYIVEWTTYKGSWSTQYPDVKKCYQAFVDEQEARDFAKTLNDAMKLIGITSLPKAIVIKNENNSI